MDVIQFTVLKLPYMKQNSKKFRASGAIRFDKYPTYKRGTIQFTTQKSSFLVTNSKISRLWLDFPISN